MRRFLFLYFAVTLLCPLQAVHSQEICSVSLGDSTVHLAIHGSADAPVYFLNLHDNENTSVEAALEVMKTLPGRLVEIKHTGERLIAFSVGNRSYQFDPNRMFTPEGRRATLNRYGSFSLAAEKAVAVFADTVLQVYGIDRAGCIVTLHNNTNNDFSAKSYLPGAIYEKEARKVYIEPGTDTDDFVVVTRRRFYRYFKRHGINVVLQHPDPTDDGSLSVYAEQLGIPYINIEAEDGHLQEQMRMIQITYQLLQRPRWIFSWLAGGR